MKPVVSSIVALAIAMAPLTAMAAEKSTHGKPVVTKVASHKKAEKTAKVEKTEKTEKTEKVAKNEKAEKAEKSDKCEKNDNAAIARVHHTSKDKPTLHHAHNVQVGGAGHKEPKASDTLIPASLTTKTTKIEKADKAEKSEKVEKAEKLEKADKHAKNGELPRLPDPNASKASASKSGGEKGGHKASRPKKSEPDDGLTERDEDFADLVARIRGRREDSKGHGSAEGKSEAKAKLQTVSDVRPCSKEPVEVIRGPEIEKFELTKCDGSVAPLAIEHLSVLIRPGSAARPVVSAAELAKKKGPELAQGIRRADERLPSRLQAIIDHFSKHDGPPKMSIISGYRPTSIGSMHSTGRAIDFRLEGVKNEDVVAFCKTLTDTGCGYYPNSSFVHVDVRDAGAGHVTWIDASGPGESPRYVSSWPPPAPPSKGRSEAIENASAKEPVKGLDREAAPESVDEHPSLPQ
ncbi:Ribonuclease E [Labilithrix luteola]|uniref:Ribonuclease E n=1 Tax=Labilithrix luteola TaxID=1391654 RepID=A0A0K1QE26_9BACT|nr:DUF882 domain-containing protein [Labilithrix luteola]AKV03912.1 Ribonuclease E [Labilithrix luteola]